MAAQEATQSGDHARLTSNVLRPHARVRVGVVRLCFGCPDVPLTIRRAAPLRLGSVMIAFASSSFIGLIAAKSPASNASRAQRSQ